MLGRLHCGTQRRRSDAIDGEQGHALDANVKVMSGHRRGTAARAAQNLCGRAARR